MDLLRCPRASLVLSLFPVFPFLLSCWVFHACVSLWESALTFVWDVRTVIPLAIDDSLWLGVVQVGLDLECSSFWLVVGIPIHPGREGPWDDHVLIVYCFTQGRAVLGKAGMYVRTQITM